MDYSQPTALPAKVAPDCVIVAVQFWLSAGAAVIENVCAPVVPQLFVIEASQLVESVSVGAARSPVSQVEMNAGSCPDTSDLKAAIFALLRALLRDTRTTDERIPMIAITTRSSMSVKPRFVDFVI